MDGPKYTESFAVAGGVLVVFPAGSSTCFTRIIEMRDIFVQDSCFAFPPLVYGRRDDLALAVPIRLSRYMKQVPVVLGKVA